MRAGPDAKSRGRQRVLPAADVRRSNKPFRSATARPHAVSICTIGQSKNAQSLTSQALGIATDVNAAHPETALYPIDVTEDGIVTDRSDAHLSKAESPIDVTDAGIVTDFSDAHPAKARSSIDLTEDGRITDVSDAHPLKADSGMDFTRV